MADLPEVTRNEKRAIPRHIDKSERAGEIALVFGFVFFVVRIPVILLSPGNPNTTFYLFMAGVVMAFLYHKGTAGKKPGYLLHLGYRAGMDVRGLLNKKHKRFVK